MAHTSCSWRQLGVTGDAALACRPGLTASWPCHPPPHVQVSALAFPDGRPQGEPDASAPPPTIKNSNGQMMEVVYEYGALEWGGREGQSRGRAARVEWTVVRAAAT